MEKKEVLRDFDLLWADRETMSWVGHPLPDTMHLLIPRKSDCGGKHCYSECPDSC